MLLCRKTFNIPVMVFLPVRTTKKNWKEVLGKQEQQSTAQRCNKRNKREGQGEASTEEKQKAYRQKGRTN